MKLILLYFTVLCISTTARGQHVEETHPKTLWCPNDTFSIKYMEYPELDRYAASTNKISPGTDARPGEYVTIYYGIDSIRLNYHNKLPYAHNIYINFESPKGKSTLRFHFNDVLAFFPADYVKRNQGNIQFDVPEVYELANIIWVLSPGGERAKDLNKEGEYYKRVVNYFRPWMNHPVFKALDFPDSVYYNRYYDFRENSFAFNFRDTGPGATGTTLLYSGPYYYVFGNELADSSLFGKLKPLVQDFAAKSGFRQFYQNNLGFYREQIKRQKELLPVKQMWTWLEVQFPKEKYQSYRVVFSPLIGGSHSTQRYATYHEPAMFKENVMFVCNTVRIDTIPGLTEKQKEGLMSGILFTEIDHNYINPATERYTKEVGDIFSNRALWTNPGSNSDYYGSPVSVFNEYFTHAVFCLYILDHYDKSTADLVIGRREEIMVSKRNFTRFKAFNAELARLRQEHRDLKVAELYPLILDWCNRQR